MFCLSVAKAYLEAAEASSDLHVRKGRLSACLCTRDMTLSSGRIFCILEGISVNIFVVNILVSTIFEIAFDSLVIQRSQLHTSLATFSHLRTTRFHPAAQA